MRNLKLTNSLDDIEYWWYFKRCKKYFAGMRENNIINYKINYYKLDKIDIFNWKLLILVLYKIR